MQAIDLVRNSLAVSDGLFNGLVQGLREHPLATQSPAGGNHALWTIGHLALWEARIPGILHGGPNPLEHWSPLFATGTKPSKDAGVYPSFDELLGTYRQTRATLNKCLDDAGVAGMARAPTNVPPGFGPMMPTFAQTFQLMAMHQMLHSGELADIRRTLGLEPLA